MSMQRNMLPDEPIFTVVPVTALTQQEKLLAAIGYWGGCIFWLFPAAILFCIKKDDSAFIRRQAAQAIVFFLTVAGIMVALVLVSSLVLFAVTLIGGVVSLNSSGHANAGATMGAVGMVDVLVGGLVWAVEIGFEAFAFLYTIVLGFLVFQGKSPNIPFVSRWTDRLLK